MADFENHCLQAKHNLEFLVKVNNDVKNYWDWQVTVCFYTAVHLINAHIAKKISQHYRSHDEVDAAINPYTISPAKLPVDDYLAYRSLRNLSRRSRYLIHEDQSNRAITASFTYDKHLAKALRKLDAVMLFMKTTYKLSFDKVIVNCIDIQKSNLNFFQHKV